MNAGRNPTCRNRNIGTPKQGHGQNNRMVIPCSWWDPFVFWERLGRHRIVERKNLGRSITFLVEETLSDSVHPCSVDDIVTVLAQVPERDLRGVSLIVLRQPKRKEQILAPVWGRMSFAAEFRGRVEPAVILEALDPGKPYRWSKALEPLDAIRLSRLRKDGHGISDAGKDYLIQPSLDAARSTQLYHTLPHEIGHWVDWKRKVLEPDDEELAVLPMGERERLYFSRPKEERETFAERYADDFAAGLRAAGLIPFERCLDPRSLKRDKLRLEDFRLA